MTEIPDEAAALVTYADGSMEFMLPSAYCDDHKRPLPRMFAFIAAVGCRASDEAWVDEQIAWMKKETKRVN